MPFLKLTTDEIRQLFEEEVSSADLLKLTLSRPLADSPWKKGIARPVLIGDQSVLQLALQTDRQEFHRNLGRDEFSSEIWKMWEQHFEHLHLFSRDKDLQFQRSSDDSCRVQRTKPSLKSDSLPTLEHNREKEYLLPEGMPIPFLVEIGIMNRAGKVLAPKYHKFRQINRFAEMVDDVTRDLPRDRPLRVVDFGSGKSYLTFAVHHLLTEVQKRECQIVGVDRNPDVIETCRRVVGTLNCQGLDFMIGQISDFDWGVPCDVVISLHACDTATDDVIGAAALHRVPVILSAPCCQHELAPQLKNSNWQAFLQHGILRERLGGLATDALRAAALEVLGYDTQLLEFVDLEHTPKNLLIRAVRMSEGARECDESRARYNALRNALGINTFRLEQILGEDIFPLESVG